MVMYKIYVLVLLEGGDQIDKFEKIVFFFKFWKQCEVYLICFFFLGWGEYIVIE